MSCSPTCRCVFTFASCTACNLCYNSHVATFVLLFAACTLCALFHPTCRRSSYVCAGLIIYACSCSVVFTLLLRIVICLQFVLLIVHVTTFASFAASTLCVHVAAAYRSSFMCAPGSACSCSPVVFTSLLCVALVLVAADLYICVHVAAVCCALLATVLPYHVVIVCRVLATCYYYSLCLRCCCARVCRVLLASDVCSSRCCVSCSSNLIFAARVLCLH